MTNRTTRYQSTAVDCCALFARGDRVARFWDARYLTIALVCPTPSLHHTRPGSRDKEVVFGTKDTRHLAPGTKGNNKITNEPCFLLIRKRRVCEVALFPPSLQRCKFALSAVLFTLHRPATVVPGLQDSYWHSSSCSTHRPGREVRGVVPFRRRLLGVSTQVSHSSSSSLHPSSSLPRPRTPSAVFLFRAKHGGKGATRGLCCVSVVGARCVTPVSFVRCVVCGVLVVLISFSRRLFVFFVVRRPCRGHTTLWPCVP